METYNNCIVNTNNIHTLKRKIKDDTIEESRSPKRLHTRHKKRSELIRTFQLSPTSTANKANDKLLQDPSEEDKVMLDYDSFTDDDETLEVPAAPLSRNYITIVDEHYVGLKHDLMDEEMNWNEQ